jgi:hypothetical protein
MRFNDDPEWLRRKAEAEDGCYVSVGGPSSPVREMYAALKAAEGHLSETLADERWHPIGHCPVLEMVRAAIAAYEKNDEG